MAKMVKCPTCGTQIEVPAAPTGQVVKCPGCGKGLKLVAKKPPGQGAPGGGTAAVGGKEGSRGSGSAGASVGGGSVTAMSFQGEPPPLDDLPNLESCAVCGRPTEFNRLVEDNGKLICPDCIKGARSRIARSAAGANVIGFKPPQEYRPTKRAKIVNITPGFIGAILAAIVWVACTVWLSSHPKPEGTAMAKPTKPTKPGIIARVTPEPATQPETAPTPTTGEATTQVATGPEPAPATEPAVPAPPPPTPEPASQPVAVAVAPTPPAPAPETPGSKVFPPEPTQAGPSAEDLAKLDPLIAKGFQGLTAKDYAGAMQAFESARTKYMKGIPPPGPLTPEQSLSVNGLVAAALGAGKADQAAPRVGMLLSHNEFSRALAINAAAVTALKGGKSADFKLAADTIKRYIDSAPPEDEYAADVYGTLLAKWVTLPQLPPADRTALESYWQSYDNFCERMATATNHTGQLKWGVDWQPADEVKGNRASRLVVPGANAQKAVDKLNAAKVRQTRAKGALDAMKLKQAQGLATASQANAVQLELEAADRAVDDAKREIAAFGSTAKPPTWLDKFEPVIPEIKP